MLLFFITETPLGLLVVGLGGGSLPLFVHDHFPKSCIDAVEIDPSMLQVATQWFGFSQSDRMKVHIADGLDYISSLAEEEGTATGEFGGVLREDWSQVVRPAAASRTHLWEGSISIIPVFHQFVCSFICWQLLNKYRVSTTCSVLLGVGLWQQAKQTVSCTNDTNKRVGFPSKSLLTL